MDVEAFLDAYGLVAVFGIMLLKGIGVPIPIPGDVLMLGISARVATGKLALPVTFVALLAALLIGGVTQFMLVRKLGRGVFDRYGRYLGFTPTRLETASRRLQKGGAGGISLAILTPGVSAIAVVACALADIPLRLFAPGLLLGKGGFLALHFLLGYIGGSVLSTLGASLPVVVGGLVAVLILSFVGWYAIRRRQRPQATASECLADAIGSWHEAVCPVCLCLGAVNRLQIAQPFEPSPPDERQPTAGD